MNSFLLSPKPQSRKELKGWTMKLKNILIIETISTLTSRDLHLGYFLDVSQVVEFHDIAHYPLPCRFLSSSLFLPASADSSK